MSGSGMFNICPTCGNWKDATTDNSPARSTIAKLEKRIGELEARLRETGNELFDCRNRYGCGPNQSGPDALQRAEAADQALTTERQRREEAEAVARPLNV